MSSATPRIASLRAGAVAPQRPAGPAESPAAPSEPAPASAPGPGDPGTAHRRRRQTAAVALLGLLLLAFVLVLALDGGGEPAPATGAAALVPSDALVYIHLSTDPTRPGVKRAMALMSRLPDHGQAVFALAQRVIAVAGGSPDTSFSRDIRPWLGNEAAFAILDTAGVSAGSVTVLAVARPGPARAFVTRAGATPAGRYDGQALLRYPTGAELSFVHGYLMVGDDASVRAGLDAATGHRRSLNGNSAYQRATAGEPAGRVLDAYVSAAGVARVLDSRSGFLGVLGALISQPSLLGTAVSVTASPPGLVVRVHSALDPRRAKADSGRLKTFTPTLQNVLPSGSTLMLDARNLSAIAPTVFRATSKIGLLSGWPQLLSRLGAALTAQGVNVHALLNLFSGETAVALAAGSGAPALVIVTRTHNEAAARLTLAGVEAPLAQVFTAPSSGPGLAPEVNDVQIAGVTAHQLRLAPGLEADYAVFRGLIVVATSLRGIGDVAARVKALGADAAYRAVLGNSPSQVTSVGFADFSQLLSLGEQSQLAQTAGFRDLLPDLQKVRAAGMDSTRGEADSTAELYLQIP